MLDAAETTNAPERVKEYADAWLTKRRAEGVVNVNAYESTLERHVFPTIGRLPLCDVHPPHVRSILEDVATGTYAKGKRHVVEKRYGGATVTKLRAILHSLFRAAQEDGPSSTTPSPPFAHPSHARYGSSGGS